MAITRFKQKTVPTYEIGDVGPGGGIIFITPTTANNQSGEYFEAARNVFTDGIEKKLINTASRSNTLVLGTHIGSGKINTEKLNQAYPSESGTCLSFVRDFTKNNQTDWFMPSKDEVTEMTMPILDISYFIFKGSSYYGNGTGDWASSSGDPSNLNKFSIFRYISYGYESSGEWFNPPPSESSPLTQDQTAYFVMPIRSFYPHGV
jgi:hypothetical protein